jgi:hypothetical protein
MATAPDRRIPPPVQPETDPACAFKAEIMRAYERGEISATEAEDWIVLNGLSGD